jgi:RHS repeat-associated protein
MGFTNVANGNLHLEIPLASFPQRGSLTYNARLVYDSLIWKVVSNTWQPSNVPNSMGGWRLITGGEPGTVTFVTGSSACDSPPPIQTRTFHDAFTWTAPDGTSHLFPIVTQQDRTICAEDVKSGTELATDASGFTMSVTNYTQATVYAPDGTQVYPKVMDTNGNFLSQDPATGNITDTLGRIPITVSPSGSTITYGVLNTAGTRTNITVTTETITATTAFGASGISECASCTMTAIQSIAFDDHTSYSFTYDTGTTSGHFGVLTSMTMRSGGTVNYGYTTFADFIGNVSRWLSSKTIGNDQLQISPAPQTITSNTVGVTYRDVTKPPVAGGISYTFNLNNGAWEDSASYSDSSSTILFVENTWDTSMGCVTPNCSGSAFIRKLTTTTGFPSGPSKTTTYTYAIPATGQPTEIDESDYSTSSPAPILRKTIISYASLTNAVSKPSQITVKDGSNNIFAQTTYTYDQGTPAPTGAPQHGVPSSSRGNITTLARLVAGTTTLSTIMTYDDTGNMLTSKDPANNITTFDYTDSFSDATGTATFAYPTKITLPPTGSVTHIAHAQYEFNTGLAVSNTDMNGNSTTFTYDSELRPLTINAPDGGQTSYIYSATSVEQDQKLTGTQTVKNTSNFDPYGRVSQQQLISDPAGADTVDITYDVNGRINSISNPHRSAPGSTDGITSYAYDPIGRVISVTEPDNNTLSASFSMNCVTFTDEATKQRKTCMDGVGRITSALEPDGSGALNWETDTAYDPLSNIVSITQKGGAPSLQWRTRIFSYDGLSRLTQMSSPESGTTAYSYTTSGGTLCAGNTIAPCRITDARGILTSRTYDALSRLTGKTYSDTTPSVTYAYDQTSVGTLNIANPNGLRTSMTDGSGSTVWSYDPMGRAKLRQQTISTVTKSIGYTYNLDGTVATIVYPSGRTYTYTYNNAAQISTLKDIANSINFFSSSQYAPPGMLTSAINGAVTGWNAITLTNSYNNRLQPTQYQAVSPVPLTLLNLSYNYDQGSGLNNGNVVSITNNRDLSRSVSYSYDQVNRLATAQTSSTWGNSYTYDAWGNLLQKNVIKGTAESMSLTVNNKNQIISPAFAYDAAGNVTSDTTHALNYDAEGRMTPVSGKTYTYDGDGRRVLKSDGTVYWIDDNLYPLSVGTTSGSITRDYIFLGSRRIAMVPISSGNPYYYLSDHLGSTSVIASGDGKTIQWDADYFPFGSVQQLFTNIVGNNYEFTGYENDSETGYNYANARFDAGRWGNFLSPDPDMSNMDASNPGSLNRYSYALNNPLTFIDPTGRDNDCGGPCTDFSGYFGDCALNVSYHKVVGEGGILYDMPDVFISCPTPQVSRPFFGGFRNLFRSDRPLGYAKNFLTEFFKFSGGPGNVPTCAGEALRDMGSQLNPFSPSASGALEASGTVAQATAFNSGISATYAAVDAHIAARGLTVPLRSSIVRNIIAEGTEGAVASGLRANAAMQTLAVDAAAVHATVTTSASALNGTCAAAFPVF